MSNHLAYIEDFCENRLSTEENAHANQRIQSDPSFAKDVAFYLQMRHLSDLEQKERLRALYFTIKQTEGSLFVENTVNLKNSVDSTKKGLQILTEQYTFLTNKTIEINEYNNMFSVKLPLLKIK